VVVEDIPDIAVVPEVGVEVGNPGIVDLPVEVAAVFDMANSQKEPPDSTRERADCFDGPLTMF